MRFEMRDEKLTITLLGLSESDFYNLALGICGCSDEACVVPC